MILLLCLGYLAGWLFTTRTLARMFKANDSLDMGDAYHVLTASGLSLVAWPLVGPFFWLKSWVFPEGDSA